MDSETSILPLIKSCMTPLELFGDSYVLNDVHTASKCSYLIRADYYVYLGTLNPEFSKDLFFSDQRFHEGLKRDFVLLHLWIMEDYEYNSFIQWLPREILEDIANLSLPPKIQLHA